MPTCPLCNKQFSSIVINAHVNSCLEISERGADPRVGRRERIYEQTTSNEKQNRDIQLLQSLVHKSLTVDGFLELLSKASTNKHSENMLDVGGILQLCVHGLESSKVDTRHHQYPESIQVHFDGEEYTVPILATQLNSSSKATTNQKIK